MRRRFFLRTHFILLTAVWFVVVLVAVSSFAFARPCSIGLPETSSMGPSGVFGSIRWFVPEFGAKP